MKKELNVHEPNGGTKYMAELVSLIDPTITQEPVEVLIWIKPGVTQQNKDNALVKIEEGLGSWENIPTSCIAFDIVEVVESATQPARQQHQLMIIVGNRADLTSGGASYPFNGNPGTWFGAVADSANLDLVAVTTHEVGHAIGFKHSTVSEIFPDGTRPVMHWRSAGSSRYPTQDDISVVSTAYPNPNNPLSNSTGTIRGRLIISGTSTPVSGVNVVAVDAATGDPVVARLSGPRVRAYQDQDAGEFLLRGLPPGRYNLRYLDGNSYRGSMVQIIPPDDNNTFGGNRCGYQADNFEEFQSGPIDITRGAVFDVGDIAMPIEEMKFDTIIEGDLTRDLREEPVDSVLPNAAVGELYKIWLHIVGGLRDISADITGLPSGIEAAISGDTRNLTAAAVHGIHFIHIEGTPNHPGHNTVWIHLVDARGQQRKFAFNLSVEPFEVTGLVADYRFEGNFKDSGEDNHHGQLIGTAQFTTGVIGQANSAVEFKGHGYLQLADEYAFDLPEFTINLVLKLEEPGPEDDWIISKGARFGNFAIRRAGRSNPRPGYAVYVHETIRGNWSSLASNAPLPVGRFFCLTVTLSNSTFKAYIDGQLVRTVQKVPPPLYNDSPAIIGGGGYYGIDSYLNGVIDSVQIFREGLTDAKVADLCHGLAPNVAR